MSPGGVPRSVQVPVVCEHDVARVIGAVTHFCHAHALAPLLVSHVATAASELANNLWIHSSRGGTVSLALLDAPTLGVELCADDDGPGIADLALAMVEGYSTVGGLGCGLPGVQRLMDSFSIESVPGCGTRVRARKFAAPVAAPGRF